MTGAGGLDGRGRGIPGPAASAVKTARRRDPAARVPIPWDYSDGCYIAPRWCSRCGQPGAVELKRPPESRDIHGWLCRVCAMRAREVGWTVTQVMETATTLV
jgi:hypothetical protein